MKRLIQTGLRACLSIYFLLILNLPALAAAPLGDWLCQGNNAGDQRQYRGQVSVLRSGQTYTVMWRFGQSTYIGTGIENGDFFAVSFTQPESQTVGLALFKRQGNDWVGRWTTLGGQILGQETWRKFGTDPGDKQYKAN